jgi:hypothetical protein
MLSAMNNERLEGLWLKLSSLPTFLTSKLAPVIEMTVSLSKQHPEALDMKSVVASPMVSHRELLPENLANP